MGKYGEVVRSLAEPKLRPGEQVIETLLVNYNGSMPATTLPGGASRSGDPDAQVTFPSARQMAIGMTEDRLVVFSLSFSGKPKTHIGDVPLSAIDAVAKTDKLVGGILELTLRSGARVDLEALAKEPVERFFELLAARVTPAPAGDGGPDLPSWDAPLAGDDLQGPLPAWGAGANEPPLPPPVPMAPPERHDDLPPPPPPDDQPTSDLPPPPT